MAENKKKIKTKVIHLSDRKRATINKYKGKVYCHFADQFSRKTFTFNKSEMKKMKKILPKIFHFIKKMESTNKNEKKLKCDADEEKYTSDNTSPYNSHSSSENEDSDSC